MSHEYVIKAIEKHGLTLDHMPMVGATLRFGEAIHDRERCLTFFHFSDTYQRWFQVTVKCCTERRRLFVSTFHGMSASDITRKRKKFQTVWPIK